tara:strand:+ start:296 stop:496 length:201 start_codon:yes stop_codon:yes gene_type:complete
MSDKVLISITEKEDGLEVQVNEGAYGNLAIVGLLEKIKLNLLADVSEGKLKEEPVLKKNPKKKYDA